MAVFLLSFDLVSHHAGLVDFVEPNLVYEHQNVYFANLFCPIRDL